MVLILSFILTGCLGLLDEEFYVQNITKDFNINIVNHPRTASLRLNDDEKFGGEEIIKETVTDVWHDENFIVLKWSPNLLPEIKKGLYIDTINGSFYQIKDKKFIDYLPEGTEIKTIDGKIYHNSLIWSRPDSLYPCKKL